MVIARPVWNSEAWRNGQWKGGGGKGDFLTPNCHKIIVCGMMASVARRRGARQDGKLP